MIIISRSYTLLSAADLIDKRMFLFRKCTPHRLVGGYLDIDQEILKNIDIDKILYRFEFGISNSTIPNPTKPRMGTLVTV